MPEDMCSYYFPEKKEATHANPQHTVYMYMYMYIHVYTAYYMYSYICADALPQLSYVQRQLSLGRPNL